MLSNGYYEDNGGRGGGRDLEATGSSGGRGGGRDLETTDSTGGRGGDVT